MEQHSSSVQEVKVPGYSTTWNNKSSLSDVWFVDFTRMVILDDYGRVVQYIKREDKELWRWKTYDTQTYWHKLNNNISHALERGYTLWITREILK